MSTATVCRSEAEWALATESRGGHNQEVAAYLRVRGVEASTTSTALPCHRNDPDLWFAEAPSELERAKQLCTACPIRRACLAGALERGEPWGVWGGEIFERGAVIERKRPRGRPRKTTSVPAQTSAA